LKGKLETRKVSQTTYMDNWLKEFEELFLDNLEIVRANEEAYLNELVVY
jgi:hypothetical protein